MIKGIRNLLLSITFLFVVVLLGIVLNYCDVPQSGELGTFFKVIKQAN